MCLLYSRPLNPCLVTSARKSQIWKDNWHCWPATIPLDFEDDIRLRSKSLTCEQELSFALCTAQAVMVAHGSWRVLAYMLWLLVLLYCVGILVACLVYIYAYSIVRMLWWVMVALVGAILKQRNKIVINWTYDYKLALIWNCYQVIFDKTKAF